MTVIPVDFRQMPKIELHVHIEGSVSSHTYFQLAEQNKVTLPCETLEEWEQFFQFKDFAHFIEVYGTAVSTIQKPEDLAILIEDFYAGQAQQEIVYSEAYLSASFLVQHFRIEEILEAVDSGMRNGERTSGVRVNIIPDIARHMPETQWDVFELVRQGYEQEIFLGLGLGGLEMNFPPRLFTETYREARNTGMKVIAHAGEAVGPESIWEAIQELKVQRIGHGIRCVEDEELLAFLKESQIPVEVSPTSNYHLGVVDATKPHPIRQMVDAGLNCCLNTDDSAMFSTTLSQEYELLHQQGFSYPELLQLNRNAIDACFLEDVEKKKLHQVLDEFLSTAS